MDIAEIKGKERKTPDEIAKEYRAKQEADKAKPDKPDPVKAEALGAASGSSPDKGKKQEKKEPEETKDNKADALKKAEEDAKENAKILSTDDKDLDDKGKAKKAELKTLEAKEIEEAESREKSNVEKRIGKLTGEIKDLRREGSQDKDRIVKLEGELQSVRDKVEAPQKTQSVMEQVNKAQDEALKTYLEEDKDLKREDRREMPREELETWLYEDGVGFHEWMAKRELRRHREREETKDVIESKAKATTILEGQKVSQAKVLAKHPDLNTDQKYNQLISEGKSKDEAIAVIQKENPKVRIIHEIIREDRDKYLFSSNGPELLVEEMEKRLKAEKPGKPEKSEEGESQEERDQRIGDEAVEAERQRQASVDAHSSSTTGKATVSKDSDEYKKQLFLLEKVGYTPEKAKAALEKSLSRRRKIPGAAVYEKD